MNGEDPEYVFVENEHMLSEISAVLQREKAVAVDLEADSMYHYQEKVCLLQFSTVSHEYFTRPIGGSGPFPAQRFLSKSRYHENLSWGRL